MTTAHPDSKLDKVDKLDKLTNLLKSGRVEDIMLAHEINKPLQELKPSAIIAATGCKYKKLAYRAFLMLGSKIEILSNEVYPNDSQKSEWMESEDKLAYILKNDFSKGDMKIKLKGCHVDSIEYRMGQMEIQLNELKLITSNADYKVSWNLNQITQLLSHIEHIFNLDIEDLMDSQNQDLPF